MKNEVNRENMKRLCQSTSHKKDSYINNDALWFVLDMIKGSAEMGESYTSVFISLIEPSLNGLMDELINRGFSVQIVPNYLKISWD